MDAARRKNPILNWVLLSLALFFLAGSLVSVWADPKEEATLSWTRGKVRVLNTKGKTRRNKKDQPILPGETIQVGAKGGAEVALPDGSTLTLSPNSHLTITSLKQPSLKDKMFSFKLAIGKVFAQVRKLTSAQSVFEIEAGGVVCGVRGTEFAVGYDPGTNHLDLDVFGGAVGVAAGGVTQVFSSGQSGNFVDGKWDGKVNPAPPPPPKEPPPATGTGSNGSGGNGAGNNGTPSNGTPNNGTSNNGTPDNGTPSNGTPSNGTPSNGTPDNGTPNNGTISNGNGIPSVGGTGSLGDLNNQFQNGVLVNSDNNLNSAQQTIHIHLVLP